MPKILVLGGAGYIGSVLLKEIKDNDYYVYDNFLYFKKPGQDIRDIDALYPLMEQADTIINLAGLSNDPISDLSPGVTWEINYLANKHIADLLKNSGKRVIYISSCSVYGFSDETFDEDSKLNPQTLYAKTKALSEDLYKDPRINSVILRLATVYGLSPMPRFDLVVNKMIGDSYFDNKIVVNGGEQWRPVVHVKDVARAIKTAIHNGSGIYNVGSNEQNYQIKDLGKEIAGLVDACGVEIKKDSPDHRSYRVDFDKIKRMGFETKHTLKDAVNEFYEAFRNGEISNITNDFYYRVRYLKRRKNALRRS